MPKSRFDADPDDHSNCSGFGALLIVFDILVSCKIHCNIYIISYFRGWQDKAPKAVRSEDSEVSCAITSH